MGFISLGCVLILIFAARLKEHLRSIQVTLPRSLPPDLNTRLRVGDLEGATESVITALLDEDADDSVDSDSDADVEFTDATARALNASVIFEQRTPRSPSIMRVYDEAKSSAACTSYLFRGQLDKTLEEGRNLSIFVFELQRMNRDLRSAVRNESMLSGNLSDANAGQRDVVERLTGRISQVNQVSILNYVVYFFICVNWNVFIPQFTERGSYRGVKRSSRWNWPEWVG